MTMFYYYKVYLRILLLYIDYVVEHNVKSFRIVIGKKKILLSLKRKPY